MDFVNRLKTHDAGIDLSITLRDPTEWQPGVLKHLSIPHKSPGDHDISAMAIEPNAGILAIGTSNGDIRLFGSPSAVGQLKVAPIPGTRFAAKTPVKFLAFAASLRFLICVASIDRSDGIHIWALDANEEVPTLPKLVRSFEAPQAICGIATSPSLTHMYIACQNGDVITYDLDRFCISPYVIPNAWTIYEERLRQSGVPGRDHLDLQPPMIMEIVIHPRDLNLLFLVYQGGVVLWNLSKREASRLYELTLHPGAVGGGSYDEETLFTERHPFVTCVSVHPSGHFFAMGHIDGCISFWAAEDDDRPLAVKTLSDPFSFTDVHVPNPMQLLAEEDDPQGTKGKTAQREPIFKLAWSAVPSNPPDSDTKSTDSSTVPPASTAGSDYEAFNETVLFILGGGLATDPQGLTMLRFPPFERPQPTEGSAPSSAHDMLLPSVRQAMKTSLFPITIIDEEGSTRPTESRFLYQTPSAVEDFLIIPRDSPHFNGTFDPVGVLALLSTTLSSNAKEKATLRAFAFPPKVDPDRPDLHVTSARLPISLTFSFETGEEAVTGSQIHKISDRRAFGRMIKGWVNYGDSGQNSLGKRLTTLNGGSAFTNLSGSDGPNLKLSKWDNHRVMVTYHRNLSIRFYDISSQLLISTDSLTTEYPQIIPHLTIEASAVGSLLRGASENVGGAPSPAPHIQSLQFAKDALECVVVLTSSDIVWYKFKEGGSPFHVYHLQDEDPSIISLDHVVDAEQRRSDGFHPICLLKHPNHVNVGNGSRVVACDLSDIGFLAIAYDDDRLVVVDMRGPRSILNVQWREDEPKLGAITSLKWTISGLGNDATLKLRLVVAHSSGALRIVPLLQDADTQQWTTDFEAYRPKSKRGSLDTSTISHSSMAEPFALFVISGKTGDDCSANPALLEKSMIQRDGAHPAIPKEKDVIPHSFLIVASKKEVWCFRNLVDERVGKVALPVKVAGEPLAVQVVNHDGYQALVIMFPGRMAIVYSLPELEQLHTITLPPLERENSRHKHYIYCDSDGDFVELLRDSSADAGRLLSLEFSTLFHFRRPLSPLVDFGEPQPPQLPPAPRPVSLNEHNTGFGGAIGAWIRGDVQKVLNGQEVDAILAGPNRPPPPAPAVNRKSLASSAGGTGEYTQSTSAGKRASSASGSADRGDVSSRLRNAVAERGQAMAQLEEKFNALESSSRDMLSQAKKVAAQQTAKRWLFG